MKETIKMEISSMHDSCPIASKIKTLEQLVNNYQAEMQRLWDLIKDKDKKVVELELRHHDQVEALKKKNEEYMAALKLKTTRLNEAQAELNRVSGYRKFFTTIKNMVEMRQYE